MSTPQNQYRTILFWTLLAAGLLTAGFMLAPFFPALAWATVLSILIHPFFSRLCKSMNPNWAGIISVFATLGFILVPLAVVGLIGYGQFAGVVSEITTSSTRNNGHTVTENMVDQMNSMLQPYAKDFGMNLNLAEWYEKNKDGIGKELAEIAPKVLKGMGMGVLTAVIALLSMFFMLRDGHLLRPYAVQFLPYPPEQSERLLNRLGTTIRSVFVSVVAVGGLQGLLATILYLAVGVPQPILFGIITTVLCIIPLLGGPVMYVPLGLLLWSNGQQTQAIILWVVGFGIISNVDNLLRPYIVGLSSPMHYLAIFFSLLGGIFVWGPVGIFLGPVVLAFLLCVQDFLREQWSHAEATA